MRILFVCTGNSCRSVLAAACLQARQPVWEVASGGIRPEAETSALTLQELRACDLAVPAEAPKHWQHAGQGPWNAIIALSEEAMVVLERSVQHLPLLVWTMSDPMDVKGTLSTRAAAYRRARQVLEARIQDWLEAGMPGIRKHEA